MARIVVMGAGIGGISQVYELRKEVGNAHEIVLVGDSDFFQFTPSHPWGSVGAYEKYFLHKVRTAKTEPYYEKTIVKLIGVERLKESG